MAYKRFSPDDIADRVTSPECDERDDFTLLHHGPCGISVVSTYETVDEVKDEISRFYRWVAEPTAEARKRMN